MLCLSPSPCGRGGGEGTRPHLTLNRRIPALARVVEMPPVRILRRGQQLVVAAGISPGAQVIGVQIAIHFFQSCDFLGTAAVIAGDASCQLAVFHFQLVPISLIPSLSAQG